MVILLSVVAVQINIKRRKWWHDVHVLKAYIDMKETLSRIAIALFALTLVNCKLIIDKHLPVTASKCTFLVTVLAQSFIAFDNSNCCVLTAFRY